MRVLIVILGLSLWGCSVNTEERIGQKWPNGSTRVIYTVEIEDGKETRVFEKQFHQSGALLLEGKLVDDKRHGKWQSFYESGAKWSTQVFEAGVRNGPCFNWHENGNLRFEGQYASDKPAGLWKFYDEAGILANEKDYDK